ncbi:MAG: GMC family oxidoreductase [Dehalococcoidia bacterium]
MLIEAADLADAGGVDAGTCVIGAGPAGLTVASELAAAGEDVVLLESGPGSSDLNRGESAGYPYFRLDVARLRGIGGSRAAWLPPGDVRWPLNGGLRSRRFDPSDFDQHDHSGRRLWPFAFDELVPHFERAEALLGLAANEGLLAPPPPTGPGLETALFQFSDPARFDAIAGELIASEHARIVRGATALRLETGAMHARCTGVTVADDRGRTFTVRARRVVVAGGGIENARLLLLSSAANPDGMGNEHGHLGRWFGEHLHVEAAHLLLADGVEPGDFAFLRRTGTASAGAIGGFRVPDAERERLGLLNATIGMLPRHVARTTLTARAGAELIWALRNRSLPLHWQRRSARVMARPDQAARALRTLLPGMPPERAMLLMVTSEQAPNPRSRVTLAASRDRLGQPRTRLEWRMTGRDLASLRGTVATASEALEATGLGRVVSLVDQPWGFPRIHGCWHAMGTTRMSADPRDGVTDPFGRVHSMENVYVAGSSVFPTGGASTVTLSIVALALRLADHLLGRPSAG